MVFQLLSSMSCKIEVGSLFLVTVSVLIVWELAIRRSFMSEILAKTRISEDLNAARLVHLCMKPKEVEWEKLFRNASNVDILLAYGRSWRGNNERVLKEFSQRKNTRMRIVLPDFNNEQVINDLTKRFDKTNDGLIQRIKEAEAEFSGLGIKAAESGAYVDIWRMCFCPVFSMYRFDDITIISFYSHREKVDVPHFVAEKGGYLYKFAIDQFEALIKKEDKCAVKITKRNQAEHIKAEQKH